MNKKWKKFFLTSAVAILGATVVYSCSKDEDTNPNKQYKIERRIARRSQGKQNTFFDNTRDSVLNANGYKKLEQDLISTRDVFSDLNDISRLQFKTSLSDVMDKEVNTSGKQIILNYFSKIKNDLTAYNINLADDWYKNVHVSFEDLAFIGAGEGANESGYGNIGIFSYNELKSHLENKINTSAINQKQLALRNVNTNLNNMRNDLISNRIDIEQKYADYYLLDKRDIKYMGATKNPMEGESVGSYRMLEQLNHKYIITSRGIDFVIPGMSPEFFADAGAKYEPVSSGANRWKIGKFGSNGIMTESMEFTYDGDFYTEDYSSEKEERLGNMNSYVDYDYDNGTAYVHFDWVVGVQQRTKDWEGVISDKDKRIIDSLNQEVRKKENIKQTMIEKQREADSIANVITQQRFGNPGR
ncbi:MAG: hypothetical protein MJ165_00540 [Alphaproteobacteria bacterium]|nr:hypothetical protein [Alphaproteobacteria bacterium]